VISAPLRRRWTEADTETLIALRAQRLSREDIAAAMDRPIGTINARSHKLMAAGATIDLRAYTRRDVRNKDRRPKAPPLPTAGAAFPADRARLMAGR